MYIDYQDDMNPGSNVQPAVTQNYSTDLSRHPGGRKTKILHGLLGWCERTPRYLIGLAIDTKLPKILNAVTPTKAVLTMQGPTCTSRTSLNYMLGMAIVHHSVDDSVVLHSIKSVPKTKNKHYSP